MRSSPRSVNLRVLSLLTCIAILATSIPAAASAYNGHPKLVVVIVIDQFRGDYLDRYRDEFTEGGFRLLLDHGAYFANCNYNYANTRTAPGHATLFTGAYSNGHGIIGNEWWDPAKKKIVTSVEDDATKLVGVSGDQTGASPHNLLSDTLGDELKLATQGKARVFGVSLKDRAAVLPGGFAADAAYWIDPKSGAFITSTFYRSDLPKWVEEFNATRPEKYWDREWKNAQGKVLRSTAHRKTKNGQEASFYEVIGSTPFANEHELEFAKQLVVYEKMGQGPATDLLAISLSPSDILGHQVGPNGPELEQMIVELDQQLAAFFTFLGRQIGLANVWIALSADHGISYVVDDVKRMRLPDRSFDHAKLEAEINVSLTAKYSPGHSASYVKLDYPMAWLDQDAFSSAHVRESDAEVAVGEIMTQGNHRGFYTKSQLARGEAPDTPLGRKYLNSYSPLGGWYVMAVPDIYSVGPGAGTDHLSPYSYDTHVPLAFYGLPFRPGTYRTSVETIDMAPTLASLLGIDAPTHSAGRVLTEALVPSSHANASGGESKP